MSTITWLGSKRVFVYSNDHAPAHVHVTAGSCKAKFELNCPGGPIVCVQVKGFAEHEVSKIKRELAEILQRLCEHWRANYGSFT